MFLRLNRLICLILAAGYFSSVVRGEWFVDNFVSSNYQCARGFNLRTCLWVLTQAFDGWGSRTVTVQSGNYIRWGQSRCVIEISNYRGLTTSITGSQLVTGLIQTAFMTADGSHGVCWGASDWRGSAKNPLITVAHSDYFHGDVGNPYRRSVDNSNHDVRGQAEDPSTNEFAAHLATLDFEELEKKFEGDPTLAAREDAALNAAVAKLQRSQGEPGSPRLHPRDMTKKTLSKRALRLGTCTAVRNDPEGITQDCYCYESTNQVGTSARYSVTCQGNEAATNSWSRGIMFDAVGNLRYLIERLNEFGWNGLVTVAGSHAGTVLFVPQNTRQQPSDRSANCCELLIHNVVTNANILPRDCFCHQDAPYQGWNMMTQNPMDIVAS